MKKDTQRSDQQIVVRLLFLVYCGVMLWLLFGQRMDGGEIQITQGINKDNLNLMPFKTLRLYWRMLEQGASEALLRHAIINLVGNVAVFIPLGWFLPFIWENMRSFLKMLLLTTGCICLVEICQLITNLGSCDIDDLILNLVGISLGYGIWLLFRKK